MVKSLPMSSQIRKLGSKLQPLIGLLLISAVLFVLAPTVRQWVAVRDILENSAVLFIMATGMTIMLISGGLDLSVGAILALVAVVVGDMLTYQAAPAWLAVLAGLAVGVLCGLINGLIVVKTGVPTLVATLGTLMVFRGVANMLGTGKDMSRFPDSFQWIGAGFAGPFAISVIMFLVVWFILTKTKLGFHAFAIGGNAEVARLSGIPVDLNKVIYYCFTGFAAALAGIVQTSRLDFATPNRGQGMELWVIAATVIGGTSMFGGVGGVGGTVIGVLIIRALEAGLIHLHVPSFWQQVAIGVVIVVAVWMDRLQIQRREKAARQAAASAASAAPSIQ